MVRLSGMATFPRLDFTCPMKWDDMRGDERQRFCSKCNRHVVNLSVLTEAQRVALLAATPREQLCVAYYQRLSGKSDTSPAPRQNAPSRRLLRLGVAAAFVTTLAAVAHHATQDRTARVDPRQAAMDAYYSMRYKVEEWADDVRVFFGGTPRRTMMILGAVCAPPTPIVAPPMAPANPSSSGDGTPGADPG
jgi:hypothetical protein